MDFLLANSVASDSLLPVSHDLDPYSTARPQVVQHVAKLSVVDKDLRHCQVLYTRDILPTH